MTSHFGISFQSDKSLDEYRELAAIVDRYPFRTVSVYQDLFFQPPWPALLQFAEKTHTPLIGPAVAPAKAPVDSSVTNPPTEPAAGAADEGSDR